MGAAIAASSFEMDLKVGLYVGECGRTVEPNSDISERFWSNLLAIICPISPSLYRDKYSKGPALDITEY
jgi:hypothetical protein